MRRLSAIPTYLILILLFCISFSFSTVVSSAPQINPAPAGGGGLDVCVFQLSSDELDVYATTNCTVTYADDSTQAFAYFYGFIENMTPRYYAYLNHYNIDGEPKCTVISNGVAYTTDNFINTVQTQAYGPPETGPWTLLVLNCVGLTPFVPN